MLRKGVVGRRWIEGEGGINVWIAPAWEAG